MGFCRTLSCCLALSFAALAVAEDTSSEQRFLAGLRARGLWQLAEAYCTERLGRADLPEPERAALTVELARCLVDRAVSSPPEARGPLWQRALQATDEFVRQYPQSPSLPAVKWQIALVWLERGELTRQEAQLSGDAAALADARAALQKAVEQLRELSGVEYELARALRGLGECSAAQSRDRADSLAAAAELLQRLAQLQAGDPIAWKGRLDLAVCHRLLGDYDAAGKLLDGLAQQKPPPVVELSLRAERIRLALAAGRLPDAIAVASQGRESDGVTAADLDFACLEVYVAGARAARDEKDDAKAAQWQAKATEQVERIEREHGPLWARRAGMLLAGYVKVSPADGDLGMLVRSAETSFRSGQFDDALAAYDSARAMAEKQGNAAQAFELGYIAATIEHQRGRHEQARDRYRQLAMAAPSQLKAPEAHGLAIYHAAQIAKSGLPEALDQYRGLMDEHLRNWPDGAAADKVRWQLGRLNEHQQDWPAAIVAYRGISPDDAEFAQAVEAVARCSQAWLAARTAAGETAEAIAADAARAAEWFESLIVGPREVLPERWSPAQRAAALAAAELRTNYITADFARGERILTAALRGATDAPPEWKLAAQALLVTSLAGQSRTREAAEVLKEISAAKPQVLLSILQGLGRLARTASPDTRRELASLQLSAIEMLRAARSSLDEAEERALEMTRAQALADAGQAAAAVAALGALVEANPQSGAIQEAYAQLLSAQEDRAAQEAAVTKWGELAVKSPQGSDRWFRAQYAVASLECRLDNKQRAARRIKMLQALYPHLGGPEMKAKFTELLEKL